MLIGLWTTTSCNLRCKYCYEGTEKKNSMMNLSTADLAVQFIIKQYEEKKPEKVVVQFHGGEPLLNFKVIKYTIEKLEDYFRGKESRILFGITTNAMLMTDEIAEFLARKMNYDLSISLDGNQEINDLNRVTAEKKGTYQMVVERALYVKKFKSDIRIRMTYNSSTVSSLSESIIHLIQLGFKKIVSVPDYFDKKWDNEGIQILLQQMLNVHKYQKENVLPDDVYISVLEERFFKKNTCTGGISNFHIYPDGSLYPCSYGAGKKEFFLGNLHNKPQIESERVESMQCISKQINKVCQGCSNYESCIGTRCKIVNKVMTGEYTKVQPVVCAIEHVKYKFANIK